ncbi:uncharacterized protein N7469_001870 [Penicillium citrinum]|uniref:Uncharacterized protein n=1 Tax=Penicillium citrinum TaxID=5077 RepID=A0A9W9PGC6_PENCI|nr:uncharacterized protein N7469_001870 [Penicillium citrinum]KAJ5243543.1 hypothetical protein N7469_001870 [Penicillium citrinum]
MLTCSGMAGDLQGNTVGNKYDFRLCIRLADSLARVCRSTFDGRQTSQPTIRFVKPGLALKATEAGDLQCAPTQTALATWRQVVSKLDMRAREESESMRGSRWSRNLDAAFPGSRLISSTTAYRNDKQRF